MASSQSQAWLFTRAICSRRRVLAGVFLLEFVGQKPAAAAAVRAVGNHALFAEQNRAGARHLFLSGKIVGFGNSSVAVMPDDLHGAAVFAGGKFEGDLSARRIGQAVLGRS